MNNEYELYHYGVKGMKWGVRKRYPSIMKERIKDAKTSYDMYKKDGNATKAYGAYVRKRISSKINRLKTNNADDKEYIKNAKKSIKGLKKISKSYEKELDILNKKLDRADQIDDGDLAEYSSRFKAINDFKDDINYFEDEIGGRKENIRRNNKRISELKEKHKNIGIKYIKDKQLEATMYEAWFNSNIDDYDEFVKKHGNSITKKYYR